MPNSFRVNITGGIDAVGDLALGDGRHVAYMENLNVRGGKAVPFNLPQINPNVSVPTNAVQIYAYRSRLFFSSVRRSYTAEYMDNRERVYWTQYGGNAQKFIGASADAVGATVPLGTPSPLTPPSASPGTYISPANIKATVGAGGTLSLGASLSFRLAFQTAYGILPPSGSVQVTCAITGGAITLTWTNPTLDIQITGIQIFVGPSAGTEVYLTTLLPKVNTYLYSTDAGGSGAAATSYDQNLTYEYCSTFVRNVTGVIDESGPSPISPVIQSSSSRMITFDPTVDGTLKSANLVTWPVPFTVRQVGATGATATPGYGVSNALSVTSIVKDPNTGNIVCTFTGNHYFYNGQKIFISGCVPDPFRGLPVTLEVLNPSITSQTPVQMTNFCYLNVSTGFTAPGTGLVGVTAYAVPSVQITGMAYLPQGGSIRVTTATPHTFGNEQVWFSGMFDPGWSNQMLPVLGDPTDYYHFFVDGMPMPGVTGASGASSINMPGLTATAALSINLIGFTGATGTMPIIGDILYFESTSLTGPVGATVTGAFPVLATPSQAFLINNYIPGVTGATGPVSGFQFIPYNDYLQYRNLYRAGGTENFQLVKQLPLNTLTYLDALPDQGLGAVLPTLYTSNGVGVVYQPPPFGIMGLIQHYGIGFAWDPSSNRLLWTAQNNLDAWPPEFYKDFDNRILALISFNQACCVFCEDGVYRGDGTDPTNLQWHKTLAAPCRAGGSVQFLNNRVIYLSDQGLTAFDGMNSQPLTDLRIPGDFWLANSGYLNNSGPGCYLVPPLQNAAYDRLRGVDLGTVTPPSLMPYMETRDTQKMGIRSFVKYGRYYLYWGADYPEFAAQTMIEIDFSSPGAPICVIGVKPLDAFVDELERVHMLLISPTD